MLYADVCKCRSSMNEGISEASPAPPTFTSMQYWSVCLHCCISFAVHHIAPFAIRETCIAKMKLHAQPLQTGLTVTSFMSIQCMNAKHICLVLELLNGYRYHCSVLPGYTSEYLGILHSEQLVNLLLLAPLQCPFRWAHRCTSVEICF